MEWRRWQRGRFIICRSAVRVRPPQLKIRSLTFCYLRQPAKRHRQQGRLLSKRTAGGSSPPVPSSTKQIFFSFELNVWCRPSRDARHYVLVAQMVERDPDTVVAGGSSPPQNTTQPEAQGNEAAHCLTKYGASPLCPMKRVSPKRMSACVAPSRGMVGAFSSIGDTL